MAALLRVALASLLASQLAAGVSLYEYYAPGGAVSSGLVAEGDAFSLNGREILLLSGAFHYFRVHPARWRDTLRKLRAAGLNAVETYVPWNLHEPRQGEFDFGALGEAMSPFLDVRAFLEMAQEEDLFVIFRPGPYICSEWDFGGMPSYLLRDPTMQVRTYYEGYRTAAGRFWDNLLPNLVDLQYTRGGPIIAVQIENEYGQFGYGDEPRDLLYMEFLRDNLVGNGFGETLFFTSDTPSQTLDLGALSGVLQTANFQHGGEEELALLKELQPGRPLMVAEFWTGWYDHWLDEAHSTWELSEFAQNLEMILRRNASVNMYMFIGGTNWGFMAGANRETAWPYYTPDTTSYDYDCLLTEAGDYTEKYGLAKSIIAKYNPLAGIVDNPEQPALSNKTAYPAVPVAEVLDLPTLLTQIPSLVSNEGPINMELLPINNSSGQSHGYLMYTAHVSLDGPNCTLKIRGHVRDMAQVLLDGRLLTKPYQNAEDVDGFGFWNGRDQELPLPTTGGVSELRILVENLGRVDYGLPHYFHQKKGLWEGSVLVDGERVDEWTMHPMEFKKEVVESLSGWTAFSGSLATPALYRGVLEVGGAPEDTWLDMNGWGKGVVFVNGFNLGRYWTAGPPKTLYLPAPLLKEGSNQIAVFEQYTASAEIAFSDAPIYTGYVKT
ncbi:beta-galactosidase-1-like protein 2 [Penaeus japonicus]|uniref:beta-galactosidase-1-like protein 2 n=1 Tax=Penaeus japonicus TaxID=27405 RepID=UPI001C70F451|nr:beta-galactosidase-1-like protein 2 [Penaeus japonicus]